MLGKVKKIYKYFAFILAILFLVNTFIVFPNLSSFRDFESAEIRNQALCYHTDAMVVFVECKNKILSFYLNFVSIYAFQFLMLIPYSFAGIFLMLIKGDILQFFQNLGLPLLELFLIISEFIGFIVIIKMLTKFIFNKGKQND